MTILKLTATVTALASLTACGIQAEGGFGRVNEDKTIDYGQGGKQKPLEELVAGVWVDPNGCDHWIIDDGIEGYLSQRLDKYGKPVCSGVAPPNTATGNYKGNQTIDDPL